ncbi:uncharacterized protein LOC120350372 [Nilaparvata lugens]|uniref:uncharacterized protein LOC120350372 n=1 Tax=Nilaparvata lugens TaxID=108931 RepID=UPI00193D4F7D|nr:uncharacterized protein LOC120350372 [Nilaparvata lugens]
MNSTSNNESKSDVFINDILSTVGECNDLYVMNTDSITNSQQKCPCSSKKNEQKASITWNTQTETGALNYNDLMRHLELWSTDLQEMENLFQNQAQEMNSRDSTIINHHSLLQKLLKTVSESSYQHDNMEILLNIIDKDFEKLEISVSCLESITKYDTNNNRNIELPMRCHIFHEDLKRQVLFNGILEYFSLIQYFKDSITEVELYLEELEYNDPGKQLIRLMKMNHSMQNRMQIQLTEMEMLCLDIVENATKIHA